MMLKKEIVCYKSKKYLTDGYRMQIPVQIIFLISAVQKADSIF